MKKIIKYMVFFLGVIIITGCGCKRELTNKTTIKDNEATSNVKVEDVFFTDIRLDYEGSITTLTAKITNNTNEIKNFIISITLKDNTGKEVKKLEQVVENLDGKSYQELSVGIIGDYSNIKNVEFYVEKDY